jgi:glycerophosphoryl diester phosphodiesterase
VRSAKVVTHIWTINEPATAMRLWAHGVQGIISDDPATILAARTGGAFV